MLDNISLKGKERKGERGHSILLRARDSRARKGKKKGKWNYAKGRREQRTKIKKHIKGVRERLH